MKRIFLLISLLALGAPTFAVTPQNMPPPVTTSTKAPAAGAASAPASGGSVTPANRGSVAPANRGSVAPANGGPVAPANRGSLAPASTHAYVGPAVVKSWTKPAGAKAAPSMKSAGKSDADDSSGLRKGKVGAVSLAGSTFHVYGQRLTFDAKSVKVFKNGKPASVSQLRVGGDVRFTMDPADPLKRRVGVIYLD
jgi:hypothetical protein